MKKAVAILLVCLSLFFLFSCGDKISSKELELIIDTEKSEIGRITADLTLTDLVGEYTIYFGDMDGKIYEGFEPIMKANGGETVHFEKLSIPSACFSLIIVNDNGEKHTADINMNYCLLPEDEF